MLEYISTIKNSRLQKNVSEQIANDLKNLEGKRVMISIKKLNRRSLKFNAWYWVEVVPKFQRGLKEMGERLKLMETDAWIRDIFSNLNPESVHEFLKDKFIDPVKINYDTGEVENIIPSTKVMTNTEFKEYADPIIQFAAEHFKIEIIYPDEQLELELAQTSIPDNE